MLIVREWYVKSTLKHVDGTFKVRVAPLNTLKNVKAC